MNRAPGAALLFRSCASGGGERHSPTVASDGRAASPLQCLDEHNLLFSERLQEVHEVDDLTAFVWRSLEEGLDTKAIVDELIAAGTSPGDAQESVAERLCSLGAILGMDASEVPALHQAPAKPALLTLDVAGVGVAVRVSPDLASEVEGVFGYLRAAAPAADARISAETVPAGVRLSGQDGSTTTCMRVEFLPLLKTQLLESALRSADYEAAFHAAALVRDERAVLLVGSPGAGKTTLTVALMQLGFGVAADDVVLLHGDGTVSGVPLPLTVKASAWPLLAKHWPDLLAEESHRRPDGQMVRYVEPRPIARERLPIASVMILERHSNARTRLQRIGATDGLTALVAEATNRDERLSARGFASIVDGLRAARCYRLLYSDVLEAAAAIERLRQ